MKGFEGRAVLVAGGTSGVGRAIAAAFLREGASVAVCGRSCARARNFRARHPEAFVFPCDATDPAGQMLLAGAVAERFGRLDILVNATGRLVERDFGERPPTADELAEEFALNLVGPVQLTAHVLSRWPCLEALVFVTSGHALVSPRRAPTFGAAAAGMHGFAEGLRRQMGPRGVHVLEVMLPAAPAPASVPANRKDGRTAPDQAARATLDALAARRPQAFVGGSGRLRTLLRLAPRATARRVGEA